MSGGTAFDTEFLGLIFIAVTDCHHATPHLGNLSAKFYARWLLLFFHKKGILAVPHNLLLDPRNAAL